MTGIFKNKHSTVGRCPTLKYVGLSAHKDRVRNCLSAFCLLLSAFCFSQGEKMIIVSHHSFLPHLSAYIEAKKHDNIDCIVISADSTDSFQSIKAKIDNVYNGFPADFLLLIGDYEHIPAYIIDEGLSDIHYTFEDADKHTPRMIAGRFSVETEQDLHTMIERTLVRNYFSKHAVGIASAKESELTQKKDYEQVQIMGEDLQSKGFVKVSELFDGSPNGNPSSGDVIMSLQGGATWMNYAGYGFYEGLGTGGFENKHIDSLPDNVELPIIVSASCLGGNFANRTCFAEKWLRSTKNGNPIGAIAVITSSSFADWDAVLSAMLVINENMPPTNSNCRLGYLYKQAYLHITDEMHRPKEAQCWVLFGDPSLWIYPTPANSITKTKPQTSPIIIYPNPVSSTLHIIPCGVVKIYDIYGKLVLTETLLTENNKLDVSSLAQGFYVVSIQMGDGVVLRKIVVRD